MKTVSITPATSGKARLRGVALASVIIALMLSILLEALDHQNGLGCRAPDRRTWGLAVRCRHHLPDAGADLG